MRTVEFRWPGQRKLAQLVGRTAPFRPKVLVATGHHQPPSNDLSTIRASILVLVVVLQLIEPILASSLVGPTRGASSEWNLDNQTLRSITRQLLCANQTSANQTSQPQDSPIRQQVNAITFIGNQISSIERGAFRCVAQELRILVLTSNEINQIPLGAFEGLNSVQVLLLDNNLLNSIPGEESLSPLRSLRHLNLADNKIEQLEKWTFGPQLSGLISLNLAGNPLLQVHPSALFHLIKLKTLTLSRCSNDSFGERPLEGLQELRFLHLDRSGPKDRPRTGVTENLCQSSPKLASLILKSNAIERVPQFAHCQNLLLLDLSYNNIRGSLSENFTQQTNLIDLYLGNNQLESIGELALIGLKKLQILELQNNRLKRIHPSAFLPVQASLEELNLSHNGQLDRLSPSGLDNLRSLKCYGNDQLRDLPHFKSATRLALTYAYHCCEYPRASEDANPWASVIVRSRPEESPTSELILWPPADNANVVGGKSGPRRRRNNQPLGGVTMMDHEWPLLSELKRIRREHSIFLPPKLGSANQNGTDKADRSRRDAEQEHEQQLGTVGQEIGKTVRCLPSPSPFLPCKDLFDGWWLRVGIWSVFLLAFVGNTLVIIVLSSVRQTSNSSALTSIMWLAHSRRHIDVPRFLVINLAIADLLMALYLGLLAFVDLSTLGQFKVHAIRWQYSAGCKLAGFLAVLSSELSVFILAIITLERNYAITNAVHLNRRLSLQKAMFIMFLGYAFALAMALMPLYGISDYRHFSVCLPLDVHSSLASQIYVITLIGINTFSFLLLLGCYLRMYFAIRGSQAWNANDLRIAKRMSILVLTDFLCWMPIIVSGLVSLFGYHLVGREAMKVLTIFVLPLNSVANPFLYAITTKKFKRDLGTLERRTRALLRLDCTEPASPTGMPANIWAHYNQQHNCHGLTATRDNNKGKHNNHLRHDLLLTTKGAKAQTARLRLVSGGGAGHNLRAKQLASEAGKRATIVRSATPLAAGQTCISCSCQQRRQQDLVVDQQQQQQQVHLAPRIVLETATQTSRHLAQAPLALLRKSRSTGSGLTMLAMRCTDQLMGPIPGDGGDSRVGCPEEAPTGGLLTKVEESLVGDELSLCWSRQRLCSTAGAENKRLDAEADSSGNRKLPSAAASANSLLVQQDPAARGPQKQYPAGVYRAAAPRSHLSVDPFQATTAGGPDIRSASACGHLASCRAVEADEQPIATAGTTTTTLHNKCRRAPNKGPSRAGVSGSCDTVRATSGGGTCNGTGNGGAIKLSRSIQRLLFGPLAKAWSSIQISLGSSVATHLGQQQPNQGRHLNEDDSLGQPESNDSLEGCPAQLGDCLDDILVMGSPLKRSMRIGERKMSRSCDAIQANKFHNDPLQFNSPNQSSAQEQSSSQCTDYDDDRRVLLATINRLAAGSYRTKLVAGSSGAGQTDAPAPTQAARERPLATGSLTTRSRCQRCRSWSPALLTKLENCIYQMKSKISSGFVSQSVGATRLESSLELSGQESAKVEGRKLGLIGDDDDEDENGEHDKEASSESEVELRGVDDDDDDDHDGDASSDDQFGEPPSDWASRRYTINTSIRPRRLGRLRQQSSVTSDSLSIRTAGTLVTNMSLSSDSNASIQLAVAGPNHQTTKRRDIITNTDTQDDDSR